jgi:hypothetical protein
MATYLPSLPVRSVRIGSIDAPPTAGLRAGDFGAVDDSAEVVGRRAIGRVQGPGGAVDNSAGGAASASGDDNALNPASSRMNDANLPSPTNEPSNDRATSPASASGRVGVSPR